MLADHNDNGTILGSVALKNIVFTEHMIRRQHTTHYETHKYTSEPKYINHKKWKLV
jgi:hypothetical protein